MKAVVIAMLLLTAGSVVLAATPTASACSSNAPAECVQRAWDDVDEAVDGVIHIVRCNTGSGC